MLAGLIALCATACAAALGSPIAAAASGSVGPGSWTVYHDSPQGTGDVAGVASVRTSARAWTSPALDGEIYGEPLSFDGRVYVATENDTVYALSAATGSVIWSAHLGAPVPAADLPCGDITPTVGITGTPVIDASRGEIFVVADELVHGRPAHMFTGLSTASGKTEVTEDVDPARVNTAALLQRTGLTLDDGRVVFGMAGNFGDCPPYRGRLFAVPEDGGTPLLFTVDAAPGESQGGIWMGGAAPVVDAEGNVWVATGNGSVYSYSHAYDDSDAVLELSPALRLLQYFAPSTWATNNSEDLDMSTAPVLLPDGQVILTGKSAIVYLLDGAHLGGIGHQQAALANACPEDIDGGIALSGMTVYLPCRSGVIAVRAARSPPALHLLWRSGTGGGPPILAAGLVWTIGQDGVLYGLDPATGKIRQQASVGAVANHFPTPSVASGLMLVPAARDVVAFSLSATAAPAPPASPTAPATRRSEAKPRAGSKLGVGGIAYLAAGAAVLIAGAAWAVRRRRTTGSQFR